MSTGSFTPHAFGDKVNAIAFSADGRFLSLGSSGEAFQIWDTSIHRTILKLAGHTGDVHSLAFFSDGKKIMSASKDGTIRVWNVELLEERMGGGWKEGMMGAGSLVQSLQQRESVFSGLQFHSDIRGILLS